MPYTITPASTPNQAQGRAGRRVKAIVCHIAEGTEAGTVSWFGSPKSGVSAHYFVCLDGRVRQFVDEANTAFANGILNNPAVTSSSVIAAWAATRPEPGWPAGLPNLESVSIEFEGFWQNDPTDAQWTTAVELGADICKRHSLSPTREFILGHYQLDRVTRLHCPDFTVSQWDRLVNGIAAIVVPTPQWNVGEGVKAAMARQGDTALGDEQYIANGFSVTPGAKAAYLYVAQADLVYRCPRA